MLKNDPKQPLSTAVTQGKAQTSTANLPRSARQKKKSPQESKNTNPLQGDNTTPQNQNNSNKSNKAMPTNSTIGSVSLTSPHNPSSEQLADTKSKVQDNTNHRVGNARQHKLQSGPSTTNPPHIARQQKVRSEATSEKPIPSPTTTNPPHVRQHKGSPKTQGEPKPHPTTTTPLHPHRVDKNTHKNQRNSNKNRVMTTQTNPEQPPMVITTISSDDQSKTEQHAVTKSKIEDNSGSGPEPSTIPAPTTSTNMTVTTPELTVVSKDPSITSDGQKQVARIRTVRGDLFANPELDQFSLVHCIAQDANMGAGIAVAFRDRYIGMKAYIQSLAPPVGSVVAWPRPDEDYNVKTDSKNNQNTSSKNTPENNPNTSSTPDDPETTVVSTTPSVTTIPNVPNTVPRQINVFNMITKAKSRGKPTRESFRRSLQSLKEQIIVHEVKKIGMPKIGSGLDRLDWDESYKDIVFILGGLDIDLIIYEL